MNLYRADISLHKKVNNVDITSPKRQPSHSEARIPMTSSANSNNSCATASITHSSLGHHPERFSQLSHGPPEQLNVTTSDFVPI